MLLIVDMFVKQKILVIYEFIVRDICYVFMFDNGYVIVLYVVDDIIYNCYGDCKDKIVVLVVMLNVIGVLVYLVLVVIDWEFFVLVVLLGMSYFDYVVVCFELLGNDYCLDVIDVYSDWCYVLDWIQGYVLLFFK